MSYDQFSTDNLLFELHNSPHFQTVVLFLPTAKQHLSTWGQVVGVRGPTPNPTLVTALN